MQVDTFFLTLLLFATINKWSQTIKVLKKMCQLAWDLNSDRYDRSQTTDLNNSQTHYHSATALTAFCCLQFSMYLAAERCARWAWFACGGRGDIKRENCSVTFFPVKKQRINAKSEPSKGSGLAISRRRQIYAMIGMELRTRGEIFVKSWRQKCEDSFVYVSYSSKD